MIKKVMIMREEQAQDLEGLIANLNLHSDLKPGSSFYVDVDNARNAPGDASVRQLLVRTLQYRAKTNGIDADGFAYEKLLLAGHRASGKTTELRKVAKELEDSYYIIYVSNIERLASRFEEEQDFLYYLIEYVISSIKDDKVLSNSVVRDLKKLYKYFEDKIFSVVQEEKLIVFNRAADIEAGVDAESKASLFAAIGSIFTKLSAKAGFESNTKEKITKSIKNNFQEFMDYANSILRHVNTELRKQGKTLLLILDGLDKLDEDRAKPLFLNSDVMLPQLECSMVVTFPIYLLYSPNKNIATAQYDRDPYVLSMIKVHDKDGKPYLPGIIAMREIARRRFNTDTLLSKEFSFDKYPEASFDYHSLPDYNGVLDVAIMMSGGNLRDFFKLLTSSAENVVIFGKDMITDEDLVNAMNRLRSEYIRRYTKSYESIMTEVLESKEKDIVVRENPQDDTLLNIFNAGLLIEYNGTRWCDIHPLMRDYIRRRIDRNKTIHDA